jgi:hypothetical protein
VPTNILSTPLTNFGSIPIFCARFAILIATIYTLNRAITLMFQTFTHFSKKRKCKSFVVFISADVISVIDVHV